MDSKQNPLVLIKTKKGEIFIELFETDAPNTVSNFISLIEKKFYDGLIFHRVVPNFVIQAGCPLGTGIGGPGYCIKLEVNNKQKHLKGYLSMARKPQPDTAGSQFFICLANTPHLDGQYAIFGKVIKGIEVVDSIVQRDVIEKIEVKRKRKEIYKPNVIRE
ncbi:MAG: peptidylprolyl isomerase [bacterium]